MPLFPKLRLALAALAGQLGQVEDARAALSALARFDAASEDHEYRRRMFASWIWSDDHLAHIVDGVKKARLITGSDTTR